MHTTSGIHPQLCCKDLLEYVCQVITPYLARIQLYCSFNKCLYSLGVGKCTCHHVPLSSSRRQSRYQPCGSLQLKYSFIKLKIPSLSVICMHKEAKAKFRCVVNRSRAVPCNSLIVCYLRFPVKSFPRHYDPIIQVRRVGVGCVLMVS